jgi:hypothetical protein
MQLHTYKEKDLHHITRIKARGGVVSNEIQKDSILQKDSANDSHALVFLIPQTDAKRNGIVRNCWLSVRPVDVDVVLFFSL